MTRQWKPGHVADYDGIRVMFTQDDMDGPLTAVDAEGDVRSGAVFGASRPHVVIDPDDREQVERLLTLYGIVGPGREPYYRRLRDALREFANPTPPKPEEPKGHLAVVEDSSGNRWVNWRDPRDTCLHEEPWVMAADSEEGRDYCDIDAVKVLSEGVQ